MDLRHREIESLAFREPLGLERLEVAASDPGEFGRHGKHLVELGSQRGQRIVGSIIVRHRMTSRRVPSSIPRLTS